MATLVAEDGTGLSTANSYCDLDTAETYFEKRLHISTWSAATDDNKEIALMWATGLLDYLVVWNGLKYTEDQALQWPRDGVVDLGGYDIDNNVIPQFLKDATAEFAMFLLASDRTLDPDTKGIKYMKAGSLAMSVNKFDRESTLPKSVWNMIKHCCTKRGSQQRYLERM